MNEPDQTVQQSGQTPSQTPAGDRPSAQYPMNDQIPRIGERDTTAGGWPAVYQTMRFAAKEGPVRTTVSLLVANRKGGFDCPSCAWPDPDDHRAPVEFCENGAKAIAWEATSRRVTRAFFENHPVRELNQQSEQWLGDQGRLTEPMVLRRGATHYEPIAWPAAFRMIAGELNALSGPDQAAFYTSGRTSNEAAFVYQLFVRQFGTNNLPDCSNMCHESSGLGLTESIGIGKGTVKLSDFDHADSIFVIGQNPGTNHPRMLVALAAASRRGCRIVSVNPLPETGMIRFKHPQSVRDMLTSGTPIASLHLPVRINGDVAVLKGIMKRMLELEQVRRGGVIDRAFIERYTHGFEALAADLAATPWEQIVEQAGVSQELIQQAAEIAAQSRRMITCWAMGVTQHRNGVANVQSIVSFNLLRGQIGRRGAGLCPVRGHSNVQGDRTMGIWERMPEAFLDALGREFGFEPPRRHGLDTVATLRAMHEGRVKLFMGLGGNFLSACPDTEYTAEAFRRCRLSVQVSTKLNRNHLVTGEQALILPCLGRIERDVQASGEQFVSCENSMGVVQQSRGNLAPAGAELMSETAIVCHLAAATLTSAPAPAGGTGRGTPRPVCSDDRRHRSARTPTCGTSRSVPLVDWLGLCADYDRIRDHIARVVPGFEDYNRRVRRAGGFYLPNPPRDRREFPTRTGRARFFVHPIPVLKLQPGQLLMMSLRSHDQFNTTIYGQDDRYRGIYGGRRVIFLNPQDVASRGLKAGQWVDITSHFEDEQRHARQFMVVPYEIPRGCAATYFPEANPLVPLRHVAEGSNQPASKSIVITLRARS